jgi:GEVED domain/Secretion system C-terminal sorting domain/Surface adhesin CshA non-repetitive domain 2
MTPIWERVVSKRALFIFLFVITVQVAWAQVSTGYFNGTVFSTYSSTTVGALSGNIFAVTYTGTFATKQLANYAPGNLPANTGFPAASPRSLELMGNAANTVATYNFTNPLALYSTLFIEDVDVNESIKIEFLTSASVLINTSNIIYRTVSTTGFAPISFAATSITIGPTATNFNEALMGFIINTNNVSFVRITQLTGNTSGTYIAYFGKPGLDHGDAPASYGDAAHLPSTNLFLGAVVAEAEATAFNSVNSDGDDAGSSATVIDDEDGVASFGALYVTSTSYSVNLTLSNTTGANATLYGWIDFNNNGVFDATERSSVVTVANGATTATVNWPLLTGLVAGTPAVRFRIAAVAAEAAQPTAQAVDGEVEDYIIITRKLPLFLTNFTGVRNGNDIIANWRTEVEVNVDHFELEYSTDGTNFIVGGTTPANNNEVNNYRYALLNFTEALYYLRLKCVDISGKIKYSSILIIRKNKIYIKSMLVTPNPVADKMALRISSDVATTGIIYIFDAMGHVLYQSQQQLVKGDNSIYINALVNAASGTYIVQARIGNESLVQKIIVSR